MSVNTIRSHNSATNHLDNSLVRPKGWDYATQVRLESRWPKWQTSFSNAEQLRLKERSPGEPDQLRGLYQHLVGHDHPQQYPDGKFYRKGYILFSVPNLAAELGWSVSKVQRYLKRGEELGWSFRGEQAGRYSASCIFLCWDTLTGASPVPLGSVIGVIGDTPGEVRAEAGMALQSASGVSPMTPKTTLSGDPDRNYRPAVASNQETKVSNDVAPPPADVHRRLYGTELVVPAQQTPTPPPSALDTQHAAAVAQFDQMTSPPVVEPVAEQTPTPPPTALDAQHTQALAQFAQMAPDPPDEVVAQPADPQQPTPPLVDPDDEAAVIAQFEALLDEPPPPRMTRWGENEKRWQPSTPQGRKTWADRQAKEQHDCEFWPRVQALGLLDTASAGGLARPPSAPGQRA